MKKHQAQEIDWNNQWEHDHALAIVKKAGITSKINFEWAVKLLKEGNKTWQELLDFAVASETIREWSLKERQKK